MKIIGVLVAALFLFAAFGQMYRPGNVLHEHAQQSMPDFEAEAEPATLDPAATAVLPVSHAKNVDAQEHAEHAPFSELINPPPRIS